MAGFFGRRMGAHERGAEAVEFALVLMPLAFLVFGTIDFGYAINRDTMVNNASREGAREGTLNTVENDIKCKVRQDLTTIEPIGAAADCAPGGTKITVTVTCRKPETDSACGLTTFNADAKSGGTVIVTVSYLHSWITPVGNIVKSGGITLSKTAEMRIE